MKTDLIQLYQNILDAQGIQFLLLSDTFSGLEQSDYGFRKKIYENYDYQTFINSIIHNFQSSKILFFQDDFQLDYCFFELPLPLQEEYEGKYILIGPVIFRFMTNANLQHILQAHQFPVALEKDFLEFYNRIPTLPTHDFWISLLMPLLRPLFGTNANFPFLDISDSLNQDSPLQAASVSEELSFDAIEARYAAENKMLQSVKLGNTDDAITWYHKFRQFNLSARTPDALRNHKNWLIILNSVLRKAVEAADVHPYYIDKISTEFAIKIESVNSTTQLENMSNSMIRKYAMLSHNYSTNEYSPLIKKCIEQIRFYYQDPLSLESLANQCAVSASYLSTQFHKETGATVIEYIHNTRMQHAILLLNSTQHSITEIANLSGFSDSNYFTRIFKKRMGMSPKAYRAFIQQNNEINDKPIK